MAMELNRITELDIGAKTKSYSPQSAQRKGWEDKK